MFLAPHAYTWPLDPGPAPRRSLYEAVHDALAAAPEQEALRFRKLRMTGGELLTSIEEAKRSLWAMGLRPGDVVSLLLPNLPHFPVLFYAANALQIVVHPLHPLMVSQELEATLRTDGSRALFFFAPLAERHRPLFERLAKEGRVRLVACEARDYLTGLERFVTAFARRPLKIPGMMRWTSFLKLGRALPAQAVPDVPPAPDAPAVYLSSGGTTGLPQTIVLSSQNFNALAHTAPAMFGQADLRGLRMLAILPFFHGFGLCMQLHAMLVQGMSSILVPQFNAAALAKHLREDRPEAICAVPTVYEALLSLGEDALPDLSFLKGAFCGGDRLRPELKARVDAFFRSRGARVTLREGYGLTETVTVNCVNPPGEDRAGTVGRPLPGHEFRIKDPDASGVGELYVTGPTVMLGYLNDPAATDAALYRDPEGVVWVRTGDLVSFDDDGYVIFRGRLKRLIKVSGISVFPQEIEGKLSGVPGVEKIVSYAVPHAYKQQVVEAAVIPDAATRQAAAAAGQPYPSDGAEAPESPLTQALMAEAKSSLFHHARPRRYRYYSELPLTRIGKVDVPALEARGTELARAEERAKEQAAEQTAD